MWSLWPSVMVVNSPSAPRSKDRRPSFDFFPASVMGSLKSTDVLPSMRLELHLEALCSFCNNAPPLPKLSWQ